MFRYLEVGLFMLYFQKRGCDATISNEFQFQEVEIGRAKFVYEYINTNNVLCLGVDPGCDATLKLITNTKSHGHDRRCYFEKLWPQWTP